MDRVTVAIIMMLWFSIGLTGAVCMIKFEYGEVRVHQLFACLFLSAAGPFTFVTIGIMFIQDNAKLMNTVIWRRKRK